MRMASVSRSEVAAVVNDAEPFEQFLPSFVGADLHMIGSILVDTDPWSDLDNSFKKMPHMLLIWQNCQICKKY